MAQAANKANGILDFFSNSVASKTRALILPSLLSTGEVTPHVVGSVLASYCKENIDVLELFRRGATELVMGLEHKCYDLWSWGCLAWGKGGSGETS